MKFKGKLSGNLHQHPDIRKYIKENHDDAKRKFDKSIYKYFFLASGVGFSGVFILILTLGFLFSDLKATLTDVFAFWNVKTIEGKVLHHGATNISVNEKSIIEIGYEFKLNEEVIKGYSYKIGYRPKKGTIVMIEYVPSNPYGLSRIQGSSYSMIGKAVLFPLGFYLLIFSLYLLALFYTFRKLSLLKNGKFASARLRKKIKTDKVVNYQTVYDLIYSINIKGENHEYKINTHEIGNLTDEAEELVLYTMKNSKIKQCKLIDELPENLRIKRDGSWFIKIPSQDILMTQGFAVGLGFFFMIFIIFGVR